jgi:hypothetical protein
VPARDLRNGSTLGNLFAAIGRAISTVIMAIVGLIVSYAALLRH